MNQGKYSFIYDAICNERFCRSEFMGNAFETVMNARNMICLHLSVGAY